MSCRRRHDRAKTSEAIGSFSQKWFSPFNMALVIGMALALVSLPVAATECPTRQREMSRLVPTFQTAINPNSSEGDMELPMPCGGKLVLRHVCVPAEGFFGDLRLDLGCVDCGRGSHGFMEGRRKAAVSGSFTLQDLPEAWRIKLAASTKRGDGRCPNPSDDTTTGFYYFIGKYEISNFQWQAVMDIECPGSNSALTVDDPRPKTGISWFEAVDFTRRYTEWLLKNSHNSLPHFSGGRFGYIRLPTEAEWEYAARGGHMVSESQLNQEEFFPLNGQPYGDYAVFTEPGAAKPPEKLAWIGSKCSNPLGLFDTAGNAAEMVLDPFRFSLGFRLHGATGGFVAKGGSYRRRTAEIMPGRREEMPFFLEDGAFRSTDLGFRVVLSAIVTPRDRYETLGQEWTTTGTKRRQTQENQKPSGLVIRLDSKKTIMTRAEQQAETVKAVIRSALFTAESVLGYSMRRQVMLYELDRLKFMKTNVVPESVLEALDGNIAKAGEAVSRVDAEIDNFVQFYINRIKESQKYPEDVFESQMDLISRELILEEGFSQSLKSRFDLFKLFKKHVALNKSQEGGIRAGSVLEDIVPAAVR
ncbi:MAG: SUMF1/EgtB/PvdO family nonheme iron enzyme [Desulfobacteraceae bacterium]|nr:MAG: SUMF1/EgtB/PvdO family nonheme iron enzyme [Desulfobacteraceae bacterium]